MTDELNRIAIWESQLLDEYRRNGELTAELASLRAQVAKWEILHGGKIDQVYSTAIDAGESFALADIRQPDPIDCGEACVLSDDKRATQVVKMRREP